MTDDRDFALIFKEEVIGKGIINAQQQENQLNKSSVGTEFFSKATKWWLIYLSNKTGSSYSIAASL